MAQKQKILYVVEAMGGGVFTYIVELANGLCDEYDITIAFGVRSETPEDFAEYFNKDIKLIRVQNFGRAIKLTKEIKAYLELRKIVKDLNPDIIHLHSSKAGAIGRMMFSGEKYKMFYTPHGYSFLMEDISPLRKTIYRTIEKLCGRRKCTTIACGKGEWEESLKVSKKAEYISNGINMQKIDEELEAIDNAENDEFTVYTVGRMDYQKNPEKFNEIAKLMPDVNFEWIGDGEMRDVITSPNVKMEGWVSRTEALNKAKSHDVFILPSRWEGLPISLLEAMYMKKPCIVSDVVGNRDIVNDGITGYICNTPQEFAEVIRKLQKGIDYSIIENAYKEIKEHYNSEWLCEKYREIYSEE